MHTERRARAVAVEEGQEIGDGRVEVGQVAGARHVHVARDAQQRVRPADAAGQRPARVALTHARVAVAQRAHLTRSYNSF